MESCKREENALAARMESKQFQSDSMLGNSFEKEYLLDWISRALATWQGKLAVEYPCLIGKKTPIRREDETDGQPSFETLMWSELVPCSVHTLRSYAAYVECLQKAGNSLNRIIWEKIVTAYGYPSLEVAESRLLRRK